MASSVPRRKLNNGREMPVIGLAISRHDPNCEGPAHESMGTSARELVEVAIDIGYRHIDTALVDGIEKQIGLAIKNKIADGTVKREDLFVTTKLWSTYQHRSRVLDGLRRSLWNLQLNYVDLFLLQRCVSDFQFSSAVVTGDPIYSSASYEFHGEEIWTPRDLNGNILYEKHWGSGLANVWWEMEKAVSMGMAKAIGFSNLSIHEIQCILYNCRIRPSNIQVAGPAFLMLSGLFRFCQQHEISYSAFTPLDTLAHWTDNPGDPISLKAPELAEIGAKHNKTPAQIMIRFLIERNRMSIVHCTSSNHLQEYLDVFDFRLDEDDFAQLDCFSVIHYG